MNNNALAIVDGKIFTRKDVFSAVLMVADEMSISGNISKGIAVLDKLDEISDVSGKAKAMLLWHMDIIYKKGNPDENFPDHILSTSKALNSRQKILEYVNVWEQIEQENIPKKIQERPMRDLIPISNMLAQGFEPSKKDWDRIGLAATSSDLSEAIRKIKGKKPRKSARVNELRRDGTIWTYKGDVKPKYVGFLDIEEAKVDADIAEAIKQIIHGKALTER